MATADSVMMIIATRSPALTHIRTEPRDPRPVTWGSLCGRTWRAGYNRVVITPATIQAITCEKCRREWESRKQAK